MLILKKSMLWVQVNRSWAALKHNKNIHSKKKYLQSLSNAVNKNSRLSPAGFLTSWCCSCSAIKHRSYLALANICRCSLKKVNILKHSITPKTSSSAIVSVAVNLKDCTEFFMDQNA